MKGGGDVEDEVVDGVVLIKSARNTTGYKGVGKCKYGTQFEAKLAGKSIGKYDTAQLAALAYSKAKAQPKQVAVAEPADLGFAQLAIEGEGEGEREEEEGDGEEEEEKLWNVIIEETLTHYYDSVSAPNAEAAVVEVEEQLSMGDGGGNRGNVVLVNRKVVAVELDNMNE